jgi:ATP-dependent DNA helicase DinG
MDHSKGNLVLFSSVWQMKSVASKLPAEIVSKCLLQGDTSKADIIRKHREAIESGQGSTIFGLASFSEGVDLPGALCSHVVIAKLPFSVPGTPVEEARNEFLEKNGQNPFMEITVPDASLKLIQAVGRLIRTEQDRGRVTILDRRLITKRYGKQLLDSLPPLRQIIGTPETRKRA